jgi:hypothetical protein
MNEEHSKLGETCPDLQIGTELRIFYASATACNALLATQHALWSINWCQLWLGLKLLVWLLRQHTASQAAEVYAMRLTSHSICTAQRIILTQNLSMCEAV